MQLSREGSVADAGGVGLHNAEHLTDDQRREPQACAHAADAAVRWRHVRVGSWNVR